MFKTKHRKRYELPHVRETAPTCFFMLYYEYGYEDSNLLVSHLLFLANSFAFSLLGASQAASKAK